MNIFGKQIHFNLSSIYLISTAVQEERGPRRPRNFVEWQHNYQLPPQSYEIIAHLFLLTIREVRKNPGFALIDRESQNHILGHLWASILCFKMAFSRTEIVKDILFSRIKSAFDIINELNLDVVERELVETIILCRKDLLSDKTQATYVEMLQENALEQLFRKNFASKSRFFKLMISLPLFSNVNAEQVYLKLFKPIVGDVPMESIICTI